MRAKVGAEPALAKPVESEKRETASRRPHHYIESHIPIWLKTRVDNELQSGVSPDRVSELMARAGYALSKSAVRRYAYHEFAALDRAITTALDPSALDPSPEPSPEPPPAANTDAEHVLLVALLRYMALHFSPYRPPMLEPNRTESSGAALVRLGQALEGEVEWREDGAENAGYYLRLAPPTLPVFLGQSEAEAALTLDSLSALKELGLFGEEP
jgi:hypothetical protein